MDVGTLARAQAMNRVALGVGLVVAPQPFSRNWIGVGTRDPRTKILSRALGARDLALAAGGLVALREGDRRWAARSFAAQAVADAVDFAAIAALDRAPLPARLTGGTLAAASAIVAGLYARELAREARRGSTAA